MAANHQLWTPIANSIDAYRRRLLRAPEATYEHVWRLLHIGEAVLVTLGSCYATREFQRLRGSSEEELVSLNKLRSHITGRADYDENGQLNSPPSDSCLGGSIGAWINLLTQFARSEPKTECSFCLSLRNYLNDESDPQPLAFLDAWKNIIPVSPNYEGPIPRYLRFEAINALRNKIAHVPLQHNIVAKLHQGLRTEIFKALIKDFDSTDDTPTDDLGSFDWHPPVRGKLLADRFFLNGSMYGGAECIPDGEIDRVQFQPQLADDRWNAAPFVYIDDECKVSLLFRAPNLDPDDESFETEYHRFAAESEPVRKTREDIKYLEGWFPERPTLEPADENEESISNESPQSEGSTAEDPLLSRSSSMLKSIGLAAHFRSDFQTAVKCFEQLKVRDELYNETVALKHGQALWKSANRELLLTPEEKAEAFRDAISALQRASEHRDSSYKAYAAYDLSKVYYHLARMGSREENLEKSLNYAKDAEKFEHNVRYVSWIDRLDEEIEGLGPISPN